VYEQLRERLKIVIQFQTAMNILQWDVKTVIPPRAHQQRAEQLAVMSKILHQMITAPEIGILLSEIDTQDLNLDKYQLRETELTKLTYKQASALPEKLVIDDVKQRAIATSQWNKAKSTNNWKLFEPELEKLLEISMKKAEYFMEPTGTKLPYDALLDTNERGMTSDMVSTVFSDLRNKLIPLVKKYVSRCQEVRANFLSRKIPIDNQKRLITDLVNYVGFDTISNIAGGRIDESAHPFTTSYFDDTRMTVNYQEDNLFKSMFGGLHEAGHSIQGQSRNPEWKWMLLGEKSSAGINESQARFVENIIGRSPEFWDSYYSRFHKFTDEKFKDISLEEMVQAINIVKPNKIRITADEMTYALHIIIRYEIEVDLFSEKIKVSEIPQIWNDKYEKYLGVEIQNDTEGALQDTHWAWAYWGYFPTYTLGNIYSGMILETLDRDLPDWKEKLSKGSVTPTIDWLKENVHYKANLYDPADMIEEITGKKLTSEPFITYLETKYSKIFNEL
jgi:carboxypeptidase Taq